MKLNKLNIAAGIVVLALPCGQAWAAPKASVDRSVRGFGDLANNQVVNETFLLRNEGDEPLVIESSKTTCGCTIARIDEKTVAPGSEVAIDVALDLNGKKGKQNASVILTTNDPARKTVTLTLQGSAIAFFEIVPDRVMFGQVIDNAKDVKTFQITGKDSEAFKILGVETTGEFFTVTHEAANPEGSSHKFSVELKPPLRRGFLNGVARIKTSSSKFPLITVAVSAQVTGSIGWTPNSIILVQREGAESSAVTRNVVLSELEKSSGKLFTISKITIDGATDVRFETIPAGTNGYRVRISNLVANDQMNGKVLLIETDHPKAKFIEIPISVMKTDQPQPKSIQPVSASTAK